MPSLIDNPVLLRDLLKKAMSRMDVTGEETAALLELSKPTVYDFLNGNISQPSEDTVNKFQKFIRESGVTDTAIIRGNVRGRVGAGRPSGQANKVNPALRAAIDYALRLLEEKKLAPKELRRLTGASAAFTASLKKMKGSRVTLPLKKLMEWHRTQVATPEEQEERLLAQMGGSKPKEGEFALSSRKPGKHYVCAFLDDQQAVDVIASLANNAAIPAGRRNRLIGTLFAQEFPTLS